jgi:hypothetical protein
MAPAPGRYGPPGTPPGSSVPSAAALAREAAWQRSSGRCEKCGYTLAGPWECHHRKLRAHGGTWELPNVLALHPACHAAGVHGQPADAYAHGWLVRSTGTPAATPVFLFARRWVLLTPAGTYTREDNPHA